MAVGCAGERASFRTPFFLRSPPSRPPPAVDPRHGSTRSRLRPMAHVSTNVSFDGDVQTTPLHQGHHGSELGHDPATAWHHDAWPPQACAPAPVGSAPHPPSTYSSVFAAAPSHDAAAALWPLHSTLHGAAPEFIPARSTTLRVQPDNECRVGGGVSGPIDRPDRHDLSTL